MEALRSKGLLCTGTFIVTFGLTLYTYYYMDKNILETAWRYIPRKTSMVTNLAHQHSTTRKQILLWVPKFWGRAIPRSKLGDGVFQHLGCKVRDCSLVTDHKLYNTSSAVFFLFDYSGTPPSTPRPPGQRWIFFTMESPQTSSPKKFLKWKGLFNWIMTYRMDYDLVIPYREINKRKNPIPDHRDYAAIMKAKPKTAAWMVSHCGAPSRRDQYVKEMIKQGINVDIYGGCGKLKCPRSRHKSCMELANKTYKFYLSFENSLCVDYITEKFYDWLPYDIIPIVRGGANYTKGIPHKWYINTADFASVKALAKYLQYIDENPREYAKYFEKRNEYILPFSSKTIVTLDRHVWCDLCEKLHNPLEPQKSYSNIGDWWDKKDCKTPKDL